MYLSKGRLLPNNYPKRRHCHAYPPLRVDTTRTKAVIGRKFGTNPATPPQAVGLFRNRHHDVAADWYPWGALNTANGGTTALFREAYKHVVTVLRLTGANFKYQLAYAMNNANNDLTPFKEFWVGDNYVDQICVSAYDGCGVFYATDRPLDDPNFRDFYYQVTAFSSRPVCIAEFSATSWCGTKPQWITESWASLANKYVKVNDINWFFENKSPPPRDWDLNYQNETETVSGALANETDAFVNGYNAFRLITTPTQRLRELMRGNNSHKH
ncbi:hypothetical protein JKP88DRAFT_241508 [Tribonema minus]|uniref:GH26 domain-containing protein n=1 Tax=Tribonema minus TaxID=303371 RepID=A0A836CCF0_9STRA|nr:hypothetical protein JKP88DRAFT_241508 [Tribonema minus]